MKAYKCPAGVWTIGYGHTGVVDGVLVADGMKITQEKAEELLAKDMAVFEKVVNKYDSKYHWNQNEFDALVSFAFNVGNIDTLTASGIRTKETIAQKMLLYDKAKGKTLPGLKKRREAERALFLKPVEVKGDDERVEKIKMIVDGKQIEVDRILKEGTNYIKIRDIAKALGLEVSANGSIPVLKHVDK